MDVVALTRELIAFNTVSHGSNEGCLQRLADLLRSLGFSVELHAVAPGRANLIARKGGEVGGLLLAGHSDTVPFRPAQKANLEATQEGGLLYGRGSCDMKGAIAAQIVAAASLAHRPVRRPLTLAFTADEEVGCVGAKAMLGTSLLRADVAIVGEPTSNRPVRMHKGYLGLKFTLTGKAAHSSNPAAGRSAIKAAARAIVALEGLEARLADSPYLPQPGAFAPDCATLNIGTISGGVARNVIPEVASFPVELRPLPGQDLSALRQVVVEVVEGEAARLGVSCLSETVTFDPPMETPAGADVVGFLEGLSGAPAGAVAFSTEGKEYNQMGIRTAIFGPGSIAAAHQEDEHVPLDELLASVEHYRAAIEHFCL